MFYWLKNFFSVQVAQRIEGVNIHEQNKSVCFEADAIKRQGNAYWAEGRLRDAAACYRQAIELNPRFAEAYSNLGLVLEAQENFNEAEESLRCAISIKPDLVEAHINLGVVLVALGRLEEAEASYRKAIQIKPDSFLAYTNLIFSLNYTNKNIVVCLEEARRFDRIAAENVKMKFTSWQSSCRPDRLRIGMISGDFRNHPVGYFLEGLLDNIDQSRFELFAYSTSQKKDELTARIEPCFAAWRYLFGENDEVAANMIYADNIHILLDLSGHTEFNRLPVFAWKPAPIQVSWLGYFATTGLTEMDYFIADHFTLPISEEVNFTEKIWRLPNTRLCFTAPNVDVHVSNLPALVNGYITFACFNNMTKINAAVVALWARILWAVPGSLLYLKNNQLGKLSIRQRIIDNFSIHGIAAERLILEGYSPRAEYLAAYHRVDIALDPFPFSGGATSAESLWMGVPVLTMNGERLVARQGVGLLMNAGLQEWIAADADDYVARAVSHSNDLVRLSGLRSVLRQKVLASTLFDSARFARDFESALSGMWHAWREQCSK